MPLFYSWPQAWMCLDVLNLEDITWLLELMFGRRGYLIQCKHLKCCNLHFRVPPRK